MIEFEITATWRYTPDPVDYDADPWEGLDPQEALNGDLDNIEKNPTQYIPQTGVTVTGKVIRT